METDEQKTKPVVTERPKATMGLTVILYGVIIILIAVMGYLLFSNQAFHAKVEQQQATIRETVQKNQLANDRQQLTFGLKTFAWAVRNSLLQGKPGEINEYFNALVKDRGIKEMLLVDPAGHVTLSTNKKNQDITFADRFPVDILQHETIYFNPKTPYELSAPITGPNQRLGTLVMFYSPAPILPKALINLQ